MLLKKDGRLQAVGFLKTDRWIDRNSGEQRRKNNMRITKLLSDEEFLQLTDILNSIDMPARGGDSEDYFDSGFSSDFPELEDHFENHRHIEDMAMRNKGHPNDEFS